MERRKFLAILGILPAMPVIAKAEEMLPAEIVEDDKASDLGTYEVVAWKIYYRAGALNSDWMSQP